MRDTPRRQVEMHFRANPRETRDETRPAIFNPLPLPSPSLPAPRQFVCVQSHGAASAAILFQSSARARAFLLASRQNSLCLLLGDGRKDDVGRILRNPIAGIMHVHFSYGRACRRHRRRQCSSRSGLDGRREGSTGAREERRKSPACDEREGESSLKMKSAE